MILEENNRKCSLVERKIRQLRETKNIDRIVVGSDSDEILQIAESTGAEAKKRPDLYCDETKASANDMIANMISLIKTDVVVWTHCTNPLISSKTYDLAIDTFNQKYPKNDSLLSIDSNHIAMLQSRKSDSEAITSESLNWNNYLAKLRSAATLNMKPRPLPYLARSLFETRLLRLYLELGLLFRQTPNICLIRKTFLLFLILTLSLSFLRSNRLSLTPRLVYFLYQT
ncbi:MAG: hypothetical protein LBL16_05290 [Endomicrobium sp.]|nr:hypothetical protein [Endomicrobium sp.]